MAAPRKGRSAALTFALVMLQPTFLSSPPSLSPLARATLTCTIIRDDTHLARILVSFLTGGESSLGDLYIESHRVGPAGVLDDELVLPVLLRRDLNRTLRSGRVVLSDFRAGGVVDEKVHVGILRAVRGGLELFPRGERQEVSNLSLVLHLDLLAIERRRLAQIGRLDVLRGTQGGDRERNCHYCYN